MTITTMFIHNDEGDILALKYAAELASLHKQPLRVVCSIPDPSNVYAYSTPEFAIGVSTVLSKQIIEEQETARARSAEAFEKVIASSGLSTDQAEFVYEPGYPPDVAAREALLASALVFPRAASQGGHALSGSCEHVMMDRALPVLIAGNDPKPSGPVIVAWDASDQAARSLRFHVPLFRETGPFIIAQSEDGLKRRGDATSPETLKAWLSHQGVEASIESVSSPVGNGLLELSYANEAAMIISGAYGHSRAGQYLFGGVTRTLMHAEAAPALALCH
ncbi:MAG: universal stress protein [Pseudomonadota bacterium]